MGEGTLDFDSDYDAALSPHAELASPREFVEHPSGNRGGWITPRGHIWHFAGPHDSVLDKADALPADTMVGLGLSKAVPGSGGIDQAYSFGLHDHTPAQHRAVREVGRRAERAGAKFVWQCMGCGDLSERHSSGDTVRSYEEHYGLREEGRASALAAALLEGDVLPFAPGPARPAVDPLALFAPAGGLLKWRRSYRGTCASCNTPVRTAVRPSVKWATSCGTCHDLLRAGDPATVARFMSERPHYKSECPGELINHRYAHIGGQAPPGRSFDVSVGRPVK